MERQQSFSHGLLYSIAPESFSELHLQDDRTDELDWEGNESRFADDSFVRSVRDFLKITAAKWRIARL
jgi:hypothetical protein